MQEWIDGGLLWAILVGVTGLLVWVGRWLERWTQAGTRIESLEEANPGQRLDDMERRVEQLEDMVNRLIWRGGAVRLDTPEESAHDGG